MLTEILSAIVNYWVVWVLGIIAAGLGIFSKKIYKLFQEEKKRKNQELLTQIDEKLGKSLKSYREESLKGDEALQVQINDMNQQLKALKDGMLSVQGKKFKQDCRDLLADDHIITLDEWEEIEADHEAYNGLGGNHKGDSLFNLVKIKAEEQLTKK